MAKIHLFLQNPRLEVLPLMFSHISLTRTGDRSHRNGNRTGECVRCLGSHFLAAVPHCGKGSMNFGGQKALSLPNYCIQVKSG